MIADATLRYRYFASPAGLIALALSLGLTLLPAWGGELSGPNTVVQTEQPYVPPVVSAGGMHLEATVFVASTDYIPSALGAPSQANRANLFSKLPIYNSRLRARLAQQSDRYHALRFLCFRNRNTFPRSTLGADSPFGIG